MRLEAGRRGQRRLTAAGLGTASGTIGWVDLSVRIMLFALVFAVAGWTLYFFVGQMMDHALTPDVGWLLRTGHYIVHTHSIPAHDLYSWTYPHRAWVVYQWLFEALLSEARHFLSLLNLSRAFILVVMIVYVWGPVMAGRARRAPLIWSVPIAGLVLQMISINMELRPMIVTSLFLWLQYEVIEAFREGRLGMRGVLLILMPAYVIWGNSHMGVSLGLLSLLLFAIGDHIQRIGWIEFRPGVGTESAPGRASVYAGLMAAVFAASLLNPYGFGIYTYLIHLSARQPLDNGIQELSSPNFHQPLMVLMLGFMVVCAMLLPRLRRVFAVHEMLHLAVFTVATLVTMRMVVWLGLFYVLILPLAVHRRFAIVKQPLVNLISVRDFLERRRTWVHALLLIAGVGLCAAAPAVRPFQVASCSGLDPGISAYLKDRQPGDRLFTSGSAGSCLLLRTGKVPVSIDTRFDFYPNDFFLGTQRTLTLNPGWQDFLRHWKANTFLVPRKWALSSMLLKSADYKVLYHDRHVVVARDAGS